MQLTATGTFSDETTQDLTHSVSWIASTSPNVATVDPDGVVHATGGVSGTLVGTTTIFAFQDAVTGQTKLTVTPAVLTSITITPPNPSIANGTSVQLTATGHFSDGTTANITTSANWTSTADATATVNSTGLVTGTGTGSATITATQGSTGVFGSTIVTVTAATLTALIVTPANPSVVAHATVDMVATAHFSDGTTQDVTQQADWTSSDTSVADIISSSSVQTNGRLDAKKPGTTTIKATVTLGGVTLSGSTLVTVTM
jgi:hypothetical protein